VTNFLKGESYQKSWSREDVIRFYTFNRNSIEDVYDSEKHYLIDLLRPGISILDIGCGAGGFYNILRQIQPEISYTGLDISEDMIERARSLYSEASFYVGRGDHLKFSNETFDLVISFGVQHMNLKWRKMIKECWRVTHEHFLFDLRLIQEKPSLEDIHVSYQTLAFGDESDKSAKVPYVILNVDDAFDFIITLEKKPKTIRAYGYLNPVSHMTTSPYKEICMASFCLGKKIRLFDDFRISSPRMIG